MKNIQTLGLFIVCLLLGLVSCKPEPKKKTPAPVAAPKIVSIPSFDVDNAYALVEKQLSFGYRYPGSEGQKKMIDFLTTEMEKVGAKVYRQDFKASFLGVKDAPATNIIASFNPDATKRIMLAAHWDSRLIAEKDPDESRRKDPIMGADDGATATAVLIEIGRLLKEQPIDMGVDLVFFDAEDQGESGETGKVDSWCLGSQHWSKNPHIKGYKAQYGILLDMVGAKDAQFGHEGISKQAAPDLLKKVWTLAQNMGYGNYFRDYDAGTITDDHYYVIVNRRIPMIDIINRPVDKTKHGFGAYHHTHDDNIDIVDKNTMKAVGKVVTAVVFNESMGRF